MWTKSFSAVQIFHEIYIQLSICHATESPTTHSVQPYVWLPFYLLQSLPLARGSLDAVSIG